MTTPFKKIVNLDTGEEIEVTLSGDELKAFKAAEAAAAAEQAEREAAAAEAAAAKQAILDRLGLTAEEAALLLS